MIPTYRFQCPVCRARFAMPRAFDERDEPAECPWCGDAGAVRELLAPVNWASPRTVIAGLT
jgi:putative FmdB family regulatory protein